MKATIPLLLAITFSVHSQTFTVKGKVSTSTEPVRYASITFVDDNDTSRKFIALTDTSGNYQLDVLTSVEPHDNLPTKFELEQNYPNPFSSATTIPYKLNQQRHVRITIYDILGREVRTFNVGMQAIGSHTVSWDGKNSLGNKVATGVYLYRLHTGTETQAIKMIYSGGNATINVPNFVGVSSNMEVSRKEGVPQIAGGTFTVRVTNTSNTRPKILLTELSNIVVQRDTTLNLLVQEGIMAYSLCYQRQDSISYGGTDHYLAWSIHLNNITGTNSKTIINWPRHSENPRWSPDGNYIAFTHQDTLGVYHLYLYDTRNDSLITNLIPSPLDTVESGLAMWTPDSRLIYGKKNLHEPVPGSWYIMNVDGSNNRQLSYCPSYVYPDNYNVLCLGRSVYHSNLDGSVYEFIVDLTQFVSTPNGGVNICGVDPNSNELLLAFDDPSTVLPNMIAKYSMNERRLDTIMVSDSGWKCYNPTFTNDFKKIEMSEVHIADTVNYTNRISVLDLQSHDKTILVEFPHKDESGKIQFIDMNTFAFSPDDKYLAYSRDVVQPALMVWWISYLTVVELSTKHTTQIDIGIDMQWNPQRLH